MTDETNEAGTNTSVEESTKPVQAPPVAKEETKEPPKKVFTRNDVRRSVPVQVHMPQLYPGFDPWGFKLRLKMTQQAEERRQEYLALSASDQMVKESEQNLDELCDLLVEAPQGFGDLSTEGFANPGDAFKNYVNTADTVAKEMLLQIVRGAITLYWRKLSPQEFRKSI